MNQDNLNNLRHSTAHLLAAAVMQLYPNVKNTIGPSTKEGFYYDFDFGDTKISSDDLPLIEQKMHEIISSWKSFDRYEVTSNEALEEFLNNEYKKELIKEISEKDSEITIYQSGNFRDLCRGGHVENPNQNIKFFKLLTVAGAYWRGSEKNKMLTRIYGTAFETQEELDNYLNMLLEAEKRNHKKLGKELELFMFQPRVLPISYLKE